MPQESKTLGQAIDQILAALTNLDAAGQIIAIKAACESLGLTIGQMKTINEPGFVSTSEADAQVSQQTHLPGGTDIRTLKNSKSPNSAIEMACIVAHYLRNLAPIEERKSEITSADIEKYFIQADYPLPKAKAQVLIDAKDAGYFDRTAGGQYRLNAVGHNLVVHTLPRTAGARKPRKPRASSARKTKGLPKSKHKVTTRSR